MSTVSMWSAILLTVLLLLHTSQELKSCDPPCRQQRNGLSFGFCSFHLSEPCNTGNILYYLFSSSRPERPQLLDPYDPETEPEMFDPSLKTHLIIHGYVGHVNFSTTVSLLAAFLRAGESNILVVDWGMLSARPCYPAAVVNTLHTGRCTAQLLHALVKKFPTMSLSQVHAIGFSLGAHVAAFASNSLRDSMGTTLGRITGLDPALPLFATLKDSWKLDSSDANFVDVIHTNVGVFGKIEAVGHADFYVNGGSVQPACTETENVPLCSHMLAPVYFAESVQSPLGFWGSPCASYLQYTWSRCPDTEERVLMGEHCNTSTRGVFFVDTGSSPPYALG